ncbi:hypothetical protein [Paenibacillus phytorum]|uniref:hypothetical protein n=1 Tax=Paenibacillus phytorum TaxID=2654977 RepID=UPI0014925FC4|nr:hypothetical protein [Paenibacillus phytorum]
MELVVLFREKWNRSGSVFQTLGGAAFGVYVFHAFILFILGLPQERSAALLRCEI